MWKPPPFDLEAHRRDVQRHATEVSTAPVAKVRNPRGTFLLRLHVWFAVLTIVYWLISIEEAAQGGPFWLPAVEGGGNIIANVLGLFVPIGPNNAIFFYVHPFGWAALILTLVTISFGNRFFERFKPTTWEKIYYNLFTLAALTLVADYLTLGSWVSLRILLSSLGNL